MLEAKNHNPTPMPTNGGYDRPYHANDVRFGRNKELTDDFTLRAQAEEAMARARTSSAAGSAKPSIGNESDGKKVTTTPGLQV